IWSCWRRKRKLKRRAVFARSSVSISPVFTSGHCPGNWSNVWRKRVATRQKRGVLMDLQTRSASSGVPRVLLTVEEAASALGLGRTYVWQLVMRSELCSVKVGRKRRVPVAALHDFVTRQLSAIDKGA